MTEAEWLVCEDSTRMLLFIKGHRTLRKRAKQRKQRLFAAACCRRLRPLLDDERSRRCIEVVERFADDQATTDELRVAETEARQIWLKNAAADTALACLQLCAQEVDGLHVSTTAVSAVFGQQRTVVNQPFAPLDGRRIGACPPEEQAQCMLVRDIFGNPFRPARLNPSWLTQTVVDLAEAIYVGRAYHDLPILADALEDGACDATEVLGHCRGEGPHVRGCWVVDLITGRK